MILFSGLYPFDFEEYDFIFKVALRVNVNRFKICHFWLELPRGTLHKIRKVFYKIEVSPVNKWPFLASAYILYIRLLYPT